VTRLGPGPNTPVTEFTSEIVSGIAVLSEVLLVVEAVDVVVVD
jgi:hypothetical protein